MMKLKNYIIVITNQPIFSIVTIINYPIFNLAM